MEILADGGIEALTIPRLAERMDASVGGLYRYFPSKVHLLVSALGREFERIDAKTDRAVLAERLTGMTCFGGVVLNLALGGLNEEAIKRMVTFSGGRGKVVAVHTGCCVTRVAREAGATANQVVLAWLLGGSPAITPIVGVSSVAQLDEVMAARDVRLSAEQRNLLDSVS